MNDKPVIYTGTWNDVVRYTGNWNGHILDNAPISCITYVFTRKQFPQIGDNKILFMPEGTGDTFTIVIDEAEGNLNEINIGGAFGKDNYTAQDAKNDGLHRITMKRRVTPEGEMFTPIRIRSALHPNSVVCVEWHEEGHDILAQIRRNTD